MVYHQNEGLLAYQQGDLERAETAFRNGIVQQRNPFLLNNLAHVITERGGDYYYALSLARHFMDLKLWRLAQRELDRAAEIAPSTVILWEMMGEVASQTGNSALMQVSLRALQARNPQHYLKYQNEGLLAYQQGDLERAEKAFRNGIVQQRNPFLLNNLAHVITERGGDYYNALTLVEEAIRRDPTEVSFLATRAAINLHLGDPSSTLKDLVELKKAGQMNHSRWLLCMEALVQLGKCEEARRVGLSISRDPALSPADLTRIHDLIRSCK